MPAKKQQRGQKIDTSKLFGGPAEDTLDWAAGHNYDEEQAQTHDAKQARSPTADDRNHVNITKAASFGNFRDEVTKTAGVPLDMPPPYVAFVKTFGRSVNEEVMKSYFSNLAVSNVVIINNDKALFAFIEFDSRDDLANALLVTGAKMMYQHPCTVDVAAPEQIGKYQNTMNKRQPRQMHGRSPTSPKVDFDRDNIFGSTSAPEVDIDDLAADEGGNNNGSGRGGRGGRGNNNNFGNGGGFRGMSKSGSANFDAGRDSIFGSAEPVAPPSGDGGEGGDGMGGGGGNNKQQRGPGRFAGGKIGVSTASAQFGEISRDSVFGSATPSPNPVGRPQFGRNQSKDSFESEGQGSSDNSTAREAPTFSRDMFGKAEVPAPKENNSNNNEGEGNNSSTNNNEGAEGENGNNSNNNGNRRGPRSPNTKSSPRGGGFGGGGAPYGREGFFGTRESTNKDGAATKPPPPPLSASEGNGSTNNNTNKSGGNGGERFARRSPTTEKEPSSSFSSSTAPGPSGDAGDRFGNLRNGTNNNSKPQQQQAPPPPPPVVKDSTGAGSSKPSYAALASGGGSWRN